MSWTTLRERCCSPWPCAAAPRRSQTSAATPTVLPRPQQPPPPQWPNCASGSPAQHRRRDQRGRAQAARADQRHRHPGRRVRHRRTGRAHRSERPARTNSATRPPLAPPKTPTSPASARALLRSATHSTPTSRLCAPALGRRTAQRGTELRHASAAALFEAQLTERATSPLSRRVLERPARGLARPTVAQPRKRWCPRAEATA